MSKERNQNLIKEVRERDNNTCQKCGFHEDDFNLEVHHIITLNPYGEDIAENMITLCNFCHNHAPVCTKENDEFYKYLNDKNYLAKELLKQSDENNDTLRQNLKLYMKIYHVSCDEVSFLTSCIYHSKQ